MWKIGAAGGGGGGASVAARERYSENLLAFHRQKCSELLYTLNLLDDKEAKYLKRKREFPEHFQVEG